MVNSSLQGYTYESTVDGATVTSNDWMNYIKIAKSRDSNTKAWENMLVSGPHKMDVIKRCGFGLWGACPTKWCVN